MKSKKKSPSWIREAINFGWEITKKKIRFFFAVIIIVLFVEEAPRILQPFLKSGIKNHDTALIVLSLGLMLVGFLLSIFVNMGFRNILLRILHGKKTSLSDFFVDPKMFGNYFIGSFFYGVVVLLGCLLFLIPGIIWAIKFRYTLYLILDKKMDSIDAMEKSSRMTDGLKWKLFRLDLNLAGIGLMGLLCFIVGVIPAIATGKMADLYVYRKLLSSNRSGLILKPA